MGVIIPNGANLCSFIFNCQGISDEIVTTLGFVHVSVTQDSPNTKAQNMADAFNSNTKPFGAANMTTEYTFVGTRVTYMDAGLPLIGQYTLNLVGTQSLDSIPANCSILANKNTASGGRRNRGRMYLPACALQGSDVLPSGFLASGEVATRQSQMNTALAAMGGFNYTPVLLHSDGGAPTAITSISIQPQIATQRRRMR